jgi:hypothetical protein
MQQPAQPLDAGTAQAAQAAQPGSGAAQAVQPGAGAPQPRQNGYEDWECPKCRKVISVSKKKPDFHRDKHLESQGCVPKASLASAAAAAAAPASGPKQQPLTAFFAPAPKSAAAEVGEGKGTVKEEGDVEDEGDEEDKGDEEDEGDEEHDEHEEEEMAGLIAAFSEVGTQDWQCYGALHEWTMPVWPNFPGNNLALAKVCTLMAPTGRFRSSRCLGIEDGRGKGCSECRGLAHVPVFTAARERARKPATDVVVKSTTTQYLTWQQLADMRTGYAAQIHALRAALFHSCRGLHRALQRVAVHARLLQSLATADVKNVRRLLLVQLKQGRSSEAIISQLAKAAAGLYQARGYSDADLDLCIIVWRCGGGRALAALAGHTGFPSESTVRAAGAAATVWVAHYVGDFERTIRHNLAGLKARLQGKEQRLLLVAFDGIHVLNWVGTDTSISGTPILTGFCAAPGHCLSSNLITCEFSGMIYLQDSAPVLCLLTPPPTRPPRPPPLPFHPPCSRCRP